MPADSPLEGNALATLETLFDDATSNFSSRYWNASSAAAIDPSLQNGYFMDTFNSTFDDGFSDNSNTSTPQYETVIVHIASPVYIFITPCLIALGVSGNLLSVFVFFKSRLYLQSNNQYLIVLQLSDTVFLLQLLPAWLSTLEINGLFNWPVFCKAFEYLTYVSCTLSSWLVLAFTTERCFVVQHPLQRPAVCTARRARAIIAALAATAALVNAPVLHFAGSGDQGCSVRPERLRYAEAFNWVDTTVTFTLPLLIIMVLNIRIAMVVCRYQRARRMLMEADDSHSRLQHKITNMLLVVSSVFFVLNLPAYVLRIYAYACHLDSSEVGDTWITLHNAATVLFNANFGINFFLYCLSAQNFRRALLQSVPCLRWLVRKFNALTGRTSLNDLRGSGLFTSAVSNRTEATYDVDNVIWRSAAIDLNHRTNVTCHIEKRRRLRRLNKLTSSIIIDAPSDKDNIRMEVRPSIIDMSDKIQEAYNDDNMGTNSQQLPLSTSRDTIEVTCEVHDSKLEEQLPTVSTQLDQTEATSEDDKVESIVALTTVLDLSDKVETASNEDNTNKNIGQPPLATGTNTILVTCEVQGKKAKLQGTRELLQLDTIEGTSSEENRRTKIMQPSGSSLRNKTEAIRNEDNLNIKIGQPTVSYVTHKTEAKCEERNDSKKIQQPSLSTPSGRREVKRKLQDNKPRDKIKVTHDNDNIKTKEALGTNDDIIKNVQISPESDLSKKIQATCIDDNNGTNVPKPRVQPSAANSKIELKCEVHDGRPKDRQTTASNQSDKTKATCENAMIRKGVRQRAAVPDTSDKIETISDDDDDDSLRPERFYPFHRTEVTRDFDNFGMNMRQSPLPILGYLTEPTCDFANIERNMRQPPVNFKARATSDQNSIRSKLWRWPLTAAMMRLRATRDLANNASNARTPRKGRIIYRWTFDNVNRGHARRRPQIFVMGDMDPQPGPSRITEDPSVPEASSSSNQTRVILPEVSKEPRYFKPRSRLQKLFTCNSGAKRRKAQAHLYD